MQFLKKQTKKIKKKPHKKTGSVSFIGESYQNLKKQINSKVFKLAKKEKEKSFNKAIENTKIIIKTELKK